MCCNDTWENAPGDSNGLLALDVGDVYAPVLVHHLHTNTVLEKNRSRITEGAYIRGVHCPIVTVLCGNPGGPGQWNPRISVLSLQSTKFRDQLGPPPAGIPPGPTDLEVNPRKASEDLQEGEHVLLTGEELEVGLLVHVPVLSAPT